MTVWSPGLSRLPNLARVGQEVFILLARGVETSRLEGVGAPLGRRGMPVVYSGWGLAVSERTFQVSAVALITVVCGVLGGALILLSCVGLLEHPWASAGLALIATACTAHICCAVRNQGTKARDAYELGRESMRLVRD